MSNKEEKSTFVEILLGLLAIVCVAAVVKAALWAWGILMRIVRFIGDAVSLLGQILIAVGFLVLAAFIVAAVLDALAPLARRWKKHRGIRAAISRSSLPKIQTFRGNPAVNPLDRWLASEVLGARFSDLFGIRPSGTAFYRQEADYSVFRAKELPNALLGPFRIVVEQYMFTPIYEAYRSGDEKVVKWTDDAITAVRKRHPLRLTGRVLRIVTFKLGFRSGEGFTRETVEDRGTDRTFIFNEILWLHFWPNASLLCGWVEMDFGMPDEEKALSEHDERMRIAEQKEEPRLLLPPPPPLEAPVIEIEHEPREEQDEEENGDTTRQAELVEEAISSVLFVIGRWQNDDSVFDSPEAVLNEDEEILRSARPFHPDADLIFEQLALNQVRRERLKTFDADFDAEMNRESSDDFLFATPWLSAAVLELDGDINPGRFRRLALRHYLSHVPPPSGADELLVNADDSRVNEECGDAQPVEPVATVSNSDGLNGKEQPNLVDHPLDVLPGMFVPEGL